MNRRGVRDKVGVTQCRRSVDEERRAVHRRVVRKYAAVDGYRLVLVDVNAAAELRRFVAANDALFERRGSRNANAAAVIARDVFRNFDARERRDRAGIDARARPDRSRVAGNRTAVKRRAAHKIETAARVRRRIMRQRDVNRLDRPGFVDVKTAALNRRDVLGKVGVSQRRNAVDVKPGAVLRRVFGNASAVDG